MVKAELAVSVVSFISNCIGGVMVRVLASGAVDPWFQWCNG